MASGPGVLTGSLTAPPASRSNKLSPANDVTHWPEAYKQEVVRRIKFIDTDRNAGPVEHCRQITMTSVTSTATATVPGDVDGQGIDRHGAVGRTDQRVDVEGR